MATSLGTVQAMTGKFYAQDDNGNVRVLNVGDTINQGEKIFGDTNNAVNSALEIVSNNQEPISLTGTNSLVFDMSTNEATFGNEEVAFSPNSAWMPTQNAEIPTEEQEVAQTEAGDITEEETAAGNEAVSSSDIGVFSFDNRDGDAVNIKADLRNTSFPEDEVDPTDEGDDRILNEEYNVTLGLTGLDVNEDEAGATFTLTLSNPTTESATLVIDANGTTYTYTIPTGSTSYSFDIPTQDSDVYIDPDTLTVSVVSLTGGGYDNVDVTGATETISISDTIDTTTAILTTTGDGDEDNGSITYTVNVDYPPQNDQEFIIELNNGQTQTIIIPAGELNGSITFAWGNLETNTSIGLNDYPDSDVYKEPEFILEVTSFSAVGNGGNYENLVTIDDSSDVTIEDTNDTVTLSITGPETVAEGEIASGYKLTVDVAPQTDLVVDVVTGHITTQDGDYVAVTTQITIPAGETESAEFSVTTNDDAYADNGEQYSVSIAGTTGGNYETLVLGNSSVTTTILDNDHVPEADPVLTTSNLSTDTIPTDFPVTHNDIAFFKKLDIGGGLDGDITSAENDLSDPADLGGSDADINDTEATLTFDITSLPTYGTLYIEKDGTYTEINANNVNDNSTLLSTGDNIYWVATHTQVANDGTNENPLTIGGDYTSGGMEASWQSDDVEITVARDKFNGDSQLKYVQGDGIGVIGNTGGPNSQLGYDAAIEKSEMIIVDFKTPVTNAEIAITHLIKSEGEVGKVEAFLDGKSVGVYTFSKVDDGEGGHILVSNTDIGIGNSGSNNSGTFTLDGIVFDQLRFSAQEYVNQNGNITDSSDYYIGSIRYEKVEDVSFNYKVIDQAGNESSEVPVKIEVATDTLVPEDNHRPTITVEDYTPNVNGENIVYEEALTSNMDNREEVDGVFTINSQDGVSSIKVGDTQIDSTELQESSTTPVTISTQYGEIEINGYNSSTGEVSYTYTILENTTNHTVAGEKDTVLDSIALEVTDSDGDTVTSSLNITVVDDIPTATTQTVTLSFEDNAVSVTTNLVFTLDVSGSMTNNDGKITLPNGEKTDRLILAKKAIIDAVEAYMEQGDVNVNLTIFAESSKMIDFSNASGQQSWMTVTSDNFETFKSIVNGLSNSGIGVYTNYEAAIDKTVDSYNIDTPAADKTVAYFLSDGNPTAEMKDSTTTTLSDVSTNINTDTDGTWIDSKYINQWTNFISGNNIEIQALGIGGDIDTSAGSYLAQLAVGSNATVDKVEDPTKLSETILSNIKGVITGTVDFGADSNGDIVSIEINGTTYNKPAENENQQISVMTQNGGVMTVNFETGEYIFEAKELDYKGISSETFKVNVVDGDGDPAAFDLVINIVSSDTQLTSLDLGNVVKATSHVVYLVEDVNGKIGTIKIEGYPDNDNTAHPTFEDFTVIDYVYKVGNGFSGFDSLGTNFVNSSGNQYMNIDDLPIWAEPKDNESALKLGTFNDGDISYGSGTISEDTNSIKESEDRTHSSFGIDEYGTAGTDSMTFDATKIIDAGAGYDTLNLAQNQNIDFSSIGNIVKNIEEINLSVEGENEITNLSARDVFDMTDENNEIKITGTSDDKVGLSNEWTSKGEESGFDVYEATINVDGQDQTIKLEIKTEIQDI